MTDWKQLAAARCPDIPPEQVARIIPSLEALKADFRPLAKQLTPEMESAVIFANVAERGK